MRAVLSWLTEVVAWVVLLIALIVIVTAVLIPRATGSTPYTITSHSMEPKFPVGSLMIVKPINMKDIKVDDVVTYQLKSGVDVVATHRVVGLGFNSHGERYLRTKGDANSIQDKAAVKPIQVRGKVWYSIPYVGHVSQAISTHQRNLVTSIIAFLLLGYAFIMFGGAVRQKYLNKTSQAMA